MSKFTKSKYIRIHFRLIIVTYILPSIFSNILWISLVFNDDVLGLRVKKVEPIYHLTRCKRRARFEYANIYSCLQIGNDVLLRNHEVR